MKLEVDIKKHLRDFDLDINFSMQDEIFALLGASGCGKSMTLKCIAGIETPDSGKIILNGRTLFDSDKKIDLTPQMRRVGYLFQNYALFPNMTVAENILFAAVGDKRSKLRENLERFELIGLENSYPHELSGGQQQRVAFARILTSHAEILLLDEPFSALDSFLKWRLELELEKVFESYGDSAILVSHDPNESFRLSDKIAVMDRGRISEMNSKQEIFKNPRTAASAILTGCKNISSAKKISENQICAEDWNITVTLNKKIPDDLKFIGIRSDSLEYISEDGENIFDFEVVKEIEDTVSYIIMVRAGDELIRWKVQKDLWNEIRSEKIHVKIPAEKIILMNG